MWKLINNIGFKSLNWVLFRFCELNPGSVLQAVPLAESCLPDLTLVVVER